MKKDKEKAIAKQLFFSGKTQAEIAEMLDVREATVSDWAKKGFWREELSAQVVSVESVRNNARMAVANYTEMILDAQKERKEAEKRGDKTEMAILDKVILSLSDSMAKTRTTVDRFDKDNAIPYVTYVQAMERIFSALRAEDPILHDATLDFQERHLREIGRKLK